MRTNGQLDSCCWREQRQVLVMPPPPADGIAALCNACTRNDTPWRRCSAVLIFSSNDFKSLTTNQIMNQQNSGAQHAVALMRRRR